MFDAIPLLGEKSRAWLGSVKGMPPDQVALAATRAAQSGLMPFGDALAIKQMADRVTNSGSMQGPPPGNVMNDLQMKIRSAITGQPMPQQMPPQGAMPPGSPPPGAMPPGAPPPGAMPPPPPAMRNAGLPTLPAPALEGPPPGAPGMAAGGIVAFQEGGLNNPYMQEVEPDYAAYGVRIPGAMAEPESEEPVPDDNAQLIAEYFRGMRSPESLTGIEARQRELSQSPKIADYAEYLRQQRELEEKSGLGEALKMQRDLLQGRGAELEKNIAEKRKIAKAMSGFAMAERASQPGASFLDALTTGLSHYARSKGELKDRELQLREAIQDKEIAAQLAEEGATREAMQAARQQREADLTRGEQRQARGDELAVRLAQLGLEKTRLGVSLMSAQARGIDPFKLIQTQLYNNRLEMAKTRDPAKLKELEEKEISLHATADALMPASQQARQGMLNREAAQIVNAQRAFDKLHGPAMQNLVATISAMESNPKADQNKLNDLKQRLADLKQQRDQLGAQPGVTEWDDWEGI